ncbi:hypothetical protein JIN84_16005 [Luteolibacter yonseiensis]|uniref:Uncharacterized protein n=1 Tax=Luteolibacter yonseiensis TaxID=1144680 RepID=A0A934R548_9BACT|nr:hypothetical protein [Luteolibacter yonseiensis]MBK1817124.1 hypothetical protein [Luteolibacter yonseiensis]
MPEFKTVALVEWHWSGHHPVYFALFASALAEIGCRVVPFCPAPEEFPALIAQTPVADSAAMARIEPADRVPVPRASRMRPARFRPAVHAIRKFGGLGNQLRAWERQNSARIDLVFFACVYDFDFANIALGERFFGFRWSGLYLHARSFRMPGSPIPYVGSLPCPEKIFSIGSLHSAGVLDEGAVGPLGAITNGRKVVGFPDLSDTRLPPAGDPDWGLANKIRSFAAGRPIISLVGHLQRTKGMVQFTRLAEDPSMKDVFFFLGGEVNWVEIPEKEREEVRAIWERAPNVYAHLQRVGTESGLNALISVSDIVMAAYTDFPNSSNILTKAAFLRRSVIVSNGYLMAERVRNFKLGQIVEEGNIGEMREAVLTILNQKSQPGDSDDDLRLAYQKRHSYPALMESFELALGESKP